MDAEHLSKRITSLEARLNAFDHTARSDALKELFALAERGDVRLGPESDVANMHCHTFFSFNAYGHSPTSLAWLAKKRGFKLIGIVDFDTLDGVDEFLDACEFLSVRGSAGLETRVHIPEFATREINSPGEPGVYYHMGIGFTSAIVPKPAAAVLADLRERAASRNRDIVSRVNHYLDPVTVDYEKDVMPLSPAGTATERHMVVAYVRAAEQTAPCSVRFWAEKLGIDYDVANALADDVPGLQNLIRSKLMKRGGVGYVQPGSDTFPTIEEFHKLVNACGALPCAAWLDGTSTGEQAIQELLELLMEKGVVALNIVPDRNWNIKDPDTRLLKVRKLREVVQLAQELDLPLNVGTELNSFGQKIVDDFSAPDLAPFKDVFLDGAYFIYGHTVLERALGLGYQSDWAKANLHTRAARSAFYTQIGKSVPPGRAGLSLLGTLDATVSPSGLVAALSECATE
jgi:hypothetical protein